MRKIYGLICLLLITIFNFQFGYAQGNFTWNRTSFDQGTWNDATNWTLQSGSDADGIPDSDDNVTLNNDHGGDVQLEVSVSASCANLTVNDNFGLGVSILLNATLTVNGTFSVSSDAGGTVNITDGSTAGALNLFSTTSVVEANASIVIDQGTLRMLSTSASQEVPTGTYQDMFLIGAGEKNFADNTITIIDDLTVLATATNINMGTSTIYFNGTGAGATQTFSANFDFHNLRIGNGMASFTWPSTGTTSIRGTFVLDGTNAFTTTGSTIEFNGSSAQTINLTGRGSTATFNNIIINNSAGVTLSGAALSSSNLAGSLTITSGTFDAGSFAVASAGGTFSVANGATFRTSATTGFPTGFSTYTLSSGSTIEYAATTQNISGTNVTGFDGVYHNLTLSGATGTKTMQGNVSIQGVLNVNGNTLNTNSNTLTILSNASGTGAIDQVDAGGSITGNVTVQRYINDGTGWYLLASPLTNAGFSDWLADFNITSRYSGTITGADFVTGFNSIMFYDETIAGIADSGWTPVPVVNSGTIDQGLGYATYQANDQKGTFPKTINLTGNVSSSTGVTQALNFTSNGAGAGINLVGNPYAAPINISLCTIDNLVGGSVQVLDASGGSFGPPASNIISSSEGFFVDVSGGGNITFPQSAKSAASADQFNKSGVVSNGFYDELLQLQITESGFSNKSYLRFEKDATTARDLEYDLRKIDNFFGRAEVATSADQQKMMINGLPLDSSYSVPVHVYKNFSWGINRPFTLAFSNVAKQLEKGICITVEDSVANISFALNRDTVYGFTMNDANKTPRIILHINSPIQTNVEHASCQNLADGKLIAQGSGNGPFNYVWTDMANQVLKTSIAKFGADTLSSLYAGLYKVNVSGNSSCKSLSETAEVLEPMTRVVADFTISSPSLFLDQAIYLENQSEAAKSFTWNMGDGTVYNQRQGPVHYYNQTGLFQINLTASNPEGCTDIATEVVQVLPKPNAVGVDANVAQNPSMKVFATVNRQAIVQFYTPHADLFTVELIDLNGKLVSQTRHNSNPNNESAPLILDLPTAAGVYIVKAKGERYQFNEKLITY